jgi:hypothetical protein
VLELHREEVISSSTPETETVPVDPVAEAGSESEPEPLFLKPKSLAPLEKGVWICLTMSFIASYVVTIGYWVFIFDPSKNSSTFVLEAVSSSMIFYGFRCEETI